MTSVSSGVVGGSFEADFGGPGRRGVAALRCPALLALPPALERRFITLPSA
jgi:hypothetical protein